MAEAILKRLVALSVDVDQWHIESAGTFADSGYYPAALSQYVMQTKGMDISSHRSQPVSMELLKNFDVILSMEIWQKEFLQVQYPEIADRVFMISEMVGINEDISDPVNGELADYQATAVMLERYLSAGIDRMRQIASQNQE